MRRLLCALTAGLLVSAPARADDDDKPFKDYYKRLREQQKKYEKWQREDRKRRDEFHREQLKRQQEMFREHRRQPYPAPGGWSPYGVPNNGSFYPPQPYRAPPFVPYGLQPGAFDPNPVYPGYGYSPRAYRPPFPGYFPPPSVRWHHGDDDDD